MEQKLPLPPFDMEKALLKVQLAEDAWNSKDPERIASAYTIDTEWRNRTEFINGRERNVIKLRLYCFDLQLFIVFEIRFFILYFLYLSCNITV
jgi:nuclear transport factor 2 (NTF2) superfamily protein